VIPSKIEALSSTIEPDKRAGFLPYTALNPSHYLHFTHLIKIGREVSDLNMIISLGRPLGREQLYAGAGVYKKNMRVGHISFSGWNLKIKILISVDWTIAQNQVAWMFTCSTRVFICSDLIDIDEQVTFLSGCSTGRCQCDWVRSNAEWLHPHAPACLLVLHSSDCHSSGKC